MKRIPADINPEILVWARERARYSPGELAHKLGVPADRYRQWESGDVKPTIRQVTELVRTLNRSLQYFYLEKVPEEPEALAEMRRLPGAPIGEESPELAHQVELAVQRRDAALRLFESLGETPPEFHLRASPSDNPEALADSLRAHFRVSPDQQAEWSDEYQALREWRHAFEGAGILVFQIPGVSLSEMRGFSLAIHPLPVVGFNSRDWPRGRIFTAFHELTHILLQHTFLDSIEHSWFSLDPRSQSERFSNSVAAATLVPRDDLRTQIRAAGMTGSRKWTDEDVDPLSERYKVSNAVLIRRLSELEFITRSSYDVLAARYDREPPERQKPSGGDFYSNKIAHYGTLLPRLAFRAYYADKATCSDLSLLLGMKVKNLGRFEEKVMGFTYGFGGQ
jgi:Zn-dependent peptidase ImmA (M78 family)/DNA-binding XRE family transcriptional regulator